jgi:hypothetical protein
MLLLRAGALGVCGEIVSGAYGQANANLNRYVAAHEALRRAGD